MWLNNGNGTFRFAHFTDEIDGISNCPPPKYNEAYFLKTKDPKTFNLVLGGCVPGSTRAYFSRTVTPKYPLKFTP